MLIRSHIHIEPGGVSLQLWVIESSNNNVPCEQVRLVGPWIHASLHGRSVYRLTGPVGCVTASRCTTGSVVNSHATRPLPRIVRVYTSTISCAVRFATLKDRRNIWTTI